MHYAALGDSISHGHRSKLKVTSFPHQIYTELSEASSVQFSLIAEQGWTSNKLLKTVHSTPGRDWDNTNLISLIIGGNDLITTFLMFPLGTPLQIKNVARKLAENIKGIINYVQRPQTTIMIGTLYNPFPQWSLLERYTCCLNDEIRLLASNEKLLLVDIYLRFQGNEKYLIDGYGQGDVFDIRPIGNPIHPNQEGHHLIAQEFLTAYRNIIPQTSANVN